MFSDADFRSSVLLHVWFRPPFGVFHAFHTVRHLTFLLFVIPMFTFRKTLWIEKSPSSISWIGPPSACMTLIRSYVMTATGASLLPVFKCAWRLWWTTITDWENDAVASQGLGEDITMGLMPLLVAFLSSLCNCYPRFSRLAFLLFGWLKVRLLPV